MRKHLRSASVDVIVGLLLFFGSGCASDSLAIRPSYSDSAGDSAKEKAESSSTDSDDKNDKVDADGAEVGMASFYANKFALHRTASGERLHLHAMTAAHRTFPFGTMVRVTNLSNGKNVVVRINDRGPVKRSRIIDMTPAAAKVIGLDVQGIVKVKLEVVK